MKTSMKTNMKVSMKINMKTNMKISMKINMKTNTYLWICSPAMSLSSPTHSSMWHKSSIEKTGNDKNE